ncbi:MAG: type II toxin-antitoxin system RelE/ParE family toxin [Solirubrobacteraceae bacterium]
MLCGVKVCRDRCSGGGGRAARLEALIYVESKPWEITFLPQADAWFRGLPRERQHQLGRRLDQLRLSGPRLGRPAVDSIKGARHPNMKELRSGTIRLLFAFDPDRRAVMLVGGDKRGEKGWYRDHVPQAARLFDDYLHSIGKGEPSRHRGTQRVGNRSAGRAI